MGIFEMNPKVTARLFQIKTVMKKKHFIFILAALFTIPLINTSCTRQVERIDEDSTVDLSGRWNDADSRMVAQAIT